MDTWKKVDFSTQAKNPISRWDLPATYCNRQCITGCGYTYPIPIPHLWQDPCFDFICKWLFSNFHIHCFFYTSIALLIHGTVIPFAASWHEFSHSGVTMQDSSFCCASMNRKQHELLILCNTIIMMISAVSVVQETLMETLIDSLVKTMLSFYICFLPVERS